MGKSKIGKNPGNVYCFSSLYSMLSTYTLLTSIVFSSLGSISDTDVDTKELTGIKGEGSKISWPLLTSRSCNTGICINLQTLPSSLKQSITSPFLSSMRVHFLPALSGAG